MKISLTLIIFFLSCSTFASVEDCYRKAEIMGGVVNHHWLKTDIKSAGMGSLESNETLNGQIGDRFEAPYTTHVYVTDHTNQKAKTCKVIQNIDEECVNAQLDIGKYLGRFHAANNCQTFVSLVLKRCSTLPVNHYGNGDHYGN